MGLWHLIPSVSLGRADAYCSQGKLCSPKGATPFPHKIPNNTWPLWMLAVGKSEAFSYHKAIGLTPSLNLGGAGVEERTESQDTGHAGAAGSPSHLEPRQLWGGGAKEEGSPRHFQIYWLLSSPCSVLGLASCSEVSGYDLLPLPSELTTSDALRDLLCFLQMYWKCPHRIDTQKTPSLSPVSIPHVCRAENAGFPATMSNLSCNHEQVTLFLPTPLISPSLNFTGLLWALNEMNVSTQKVQSLHGSYLLLSSWL